MSKKGHKKTNALRILDTHHIPYEVFTYEWSEEQAAGVHVAESLQIPVEQVFKTLVGKGNVTGHVVFCIPVEGELDMKQAARVSGNKSVELIAVKELLPLTGYLRGGCSPLGMKKAFPTFFDASIEHISSVYVSAGLRGMQVQVEPTSLITVVEGTVAPLTMG
ncbi:Cys-tRNA(Pro) deacylase [Veillonella sp. CHU740]|uniref:Cys-tRNA(Pro) deacylase n=1 Tax=Veillonella sp. CHU740 TaxID=2490950 RepID=UPI000F8D16B2|nr:Cys-tRNA(Pro) deacylase [Veillonella sp. CHU740]